MRVNAIVIRCVNVWWSDIKEITWSVNNPQIINVVKFQVKVEDRVQRTSLMMSTLQGEKCFSCYNEI